MSAKPRVGIACSRQTQELYIGSAELDTLREFADVEIQHFEVEHPRWGEVPLIDAQQERLAVFAENLDALVVSHGSARVTQAVLARAPKLRFVGDIEGDRQAQRIDMSAARAAGVTVVDTSHASSWPVSEWALALALLGLRQHARMHDMIMRKPMLQHDYRVNAPGRELTGKEVAILGFGHIGWRLREFLIPFRTRVLAYDPYAPRELADALDVEFTSLERAMQADVVVCLIPGVASTIGMIGEAELALLRENSVFINVGRGAVVDSKALLARAKQGGVWFGLDAHDVEPIPEDSELRGLKNVFLSAHIGGMTDEAQVRFFALMVEELEREFGGFEPRAQLTDRVMQGRNVQL